MSVNVEERKRFQAEDAQPLARLLPGDLTGEDHKSGRYSYFGDHERFVIVVGAQEPDVDWALVCGLAERHGRRLVLVLPADAAFATRQRAPWLTDETRPEIWTHQARAVTRAPVLDREQTVESVTRWAKDRSAGKGPVAELKTASTPLHLGRFSAGVTALAEWATSDPQLDAAHRQGERSWHCLGQKVLSLRLQHGVLDIRAGIHDGARSAHPDRTVQPGEALAEDDLRALQDGVNAGITARSTPGPPYGPDEHWLQSRMRQDPSLVGVESPALREVPAWRPSGAENTFGRGYLDLLGLDGHGDVRLVEAKLARSTDEMTLLQGLDYHVWATAYRQAILEKLSAPDAARIRLHYAVGTTPADTHHLPARVFQYAHALDTHAVPFRFHIISGWDTTIPSTRTTTRTHALPDGELPQPGMNPA